MAIIVALALSALAQRAVELETAAQRLRNRAARPVADASLDERENVKALRKLATGIAGRLEGQALRMRKAAREGKDPAPFEAEAKALVKDAEKELREFEATNRVSKAEHEVYLSVIKNLAA